MNTQQITIDIPQGIIDSVPCAVVEEEIRRYLAVKYYHEEALTFGKAAEFAGMNRMDFELFLAQNHLPISLLSYEDVRSDLEQMKTIARSACS